MQQGHNVGRIVPEQGPLGKDMTRPCYALGKDIA